MTIAIERTNSVKQTRTFLFDLIDPKKTPKVPKDIRDRASYLLKHYPSDVEVDVVAEREDAAIQDQYKIFSKKF